MEIGSYEGFRFFFFFPPFMQREFQGFDDINRRGAKEIKKIIIWEKGPISNSLGLQSCFPLLQGFFLNPPFFIFFSFCFFNALYSVLLQHSSQISYWKQRARCFILFLKYVGLKTKCQIVIKKIFDSTKRFQYLLKG